MVTQYL